MHHFDRQQLEYARSPANGGSGELTESEELELAAELLEVASEEEFGKWLTDLATRAKRVTGKAVVANPRAVDTTVKVVQAVAPPISLIHDVSQGVPPDLALLRANQLPGTIERSANWLRSVADRWSKLELEGLSGEERELEYARRYTRFAHRALRNAWSAPRRIPPQRAAYLSVRHAARRDLPGLVPQITQIFHIGANEVASSRTGRWHRTRNAIVIDLG